VRGIGAANSWILCESFIDLDTTTLKTRYSNVPTGVIVDPIIRTFNPSATGIIASLVGLDDGSNTIEGEQVLIADYYCAKDYQRVILCNNPDPTLGSIREVQQVTSWSDGEIRFTLDGMRIDPANCWAIVFDKDENILSTLMIGNPTEVFQDVRYPSSVYTGSSGRCSILDTIWVCSSSDFEFECDFLIPEGSCDKVSLTYNTFTDLIEYDLINQQWNFRFGSGGTEFFGVSATTKFDTGDWVSIKVVTRVGSFDVYINGSATPEYSGSGVINVFNGNQFGRVNSGTPNTTPKLYMRNIKLTDVGTTSNSKYWKLNEQLGLRISDYSQDTNGVVTKDMSFIDNWAYLPNEGY